MKRIFLLVIILLLIPKFSIASEQINLKEFAGEVKKYSEEIFPEFSDENWISEVISRKNEFGWTRHLSKNC